MKLTLETSCDTKYCGECAAADCSHNGSKLHYCRYFKVFINEKKESFVLRCKECIEKFGKGEST